MGLRKFCSEPRVAAPPSTALHSARKISPNSSRPYWRKCSRRWKRIIRSIPIETPAPSPVSPWAARNLCSPDSITSTGSRGLARSARADLAATSSAFPQLTSAANEQLHLLWIACGTEDHLITANRNLVTWLKGKGIHLTQIETPGMHTWMVWRRDLIEFAPLLFKNPQ